MATCFNCGAELHWDGDFMASELGLADSDEMEDSVVNVPTCPGCHAHVWVQHESENERLEREADEE